MVDRPLKFDEAIIAGGLDWEVGSPESLHKTYKNEQRGWLMTVGEFTEMVSHKQNMRS